MKKIILTFVAILFLMSAFFVPRLGAEAPPVFTGPESTISMDFQGASLEEILKALSIQAEMNFIASEGVKERKITLYFDKVPLSQVMNKIFSANNLSYELDKEANIFVVKDMGKLGVETVTKVFYLKHATVSSSALNEEKSKGTTSSVGASGNSSTSSSTSTSNSTNTSTSGTSGATGRYKVADESGITSAIKKLLSTDGSVMEDYRTNSLIVTDTPIKMKVIAQVIASLDVPVPQVMLEVEMLDVSKNVVDKMGFDFGDSPFTTIVTGATASMGFPYGSWGKLFNEGAGTLSINPSTYQIQLNFIRTQTDTKFLARPKLLTLNNETAEISITKDEIVGKNPIMGTSTTGAITIIGYNYTRSTDLALTKEGTGIFLRVTPQINPDTNEITMVVNPKSSITSTSSVSSDQIDAEVRSTKSTVKIMDGETIVLGGLIHQEKTLTTKKLPFFGDIPLLGALFRSKNKTKDLDRELLVFITPHIIKDKPDIKLVQIKNIQLPIREQGVAAGTSRDYVINSNMNKFEKKH